MKPRITHITLSGGGACGIAYLGCIRFLRVERLLTHVRHVSGASIGALFAAIIALDIPYEHLERLVRKHITTPVNFSMAQILNTFTNLGIDDGAFMTLMLREYLQEAYGVDDMTFIELTKKTGKHLVISANCVETMRPMYFSVNTTPDLSILRAVHASMSVPILVMPCKIGELHYSDGGTCDNLPVACFDEQPHEKNNHLAFIISPPNASATVTSNPMSSFMCYVFAHVHTYMNSCIRNNNKPTKWIVHLNECPLTFLPLKFNKDGMVLCVSDDEVDASIAYGYQKMQQWLATIEMP